MGTLRPVVMIGAPVRNRAWILPAYLAALEALEYPEEALRFCWIVNDSTDDTETILSEWGNVARATPRHIRLRRHDLGADATISGDRGRYSIEHLAQLRNRLLKEFIAGDAEYLLSLDTDILIGPQDLRQLLEDGRDLVSGLIRNDGHMAARPRPYYNICRRTGPAGDYAHMHELPVEPVFEVDLTGAVILIRRQVVEAGVRYRPTSVGEDAGFCAAAQAVGFRIWCDQRVRPEHVMTKGVTL